MSAYEQVIEERFCDPSGCGVMCPCDPQIIRKVEKQSVVLDADENISQLHKVSSQCVAV